MVTIAPRYVDTPGNVSYHVRDECRGLEMANEERIKEGTGDRRICRDCLEFLLREYYGGSS